MNKKRIKNSAITVSILALAVFASPHTAVAADNMAAYWKFDETSGTAPADSSGDGVTGTGVSTPTIETDVATLAFTSVRSLDFNGSTEYVKFGDKLDLNRADAMTISMWIKPDTITGAEFRALVTKQDNEANYTGWGFWMRNNDGGPAAALEFSYNDDGDASVDTFATSVEDIGAGSWIHVVVVYNNETITFYKNGSAMSNGASGTGATTNVNSAVELCVACDDLATDELFDGNIDDVRIYTRALSTTEISALAAGNHTSATWDGSTDTAWATGANWDINAQPDPYTKLTIADVTNNPLMSENTGAASVTIDSGGIMDTEGFNLTFNDSGAFVNNGTLIIEGDETLSGFTNDTDTGLITYDGTGTYASGLIAGDTYNDLTFSGSGGTWTLDAALDVNDDLALTTGTLDVSGTNYGITVGGDWTDAGAGAFTEQGGTVTFDGTGTLSANETFENVTINSGGTVTLGAALDLDDTLTLTAGTLDVSGTNYGITAKSWTDAGAGAFTEQGGTVTFDVAAGTINSNETFENVTINHAGTTTLGAALDLDDTLTITAGTLDVSGTNYGITAKSWTDSGAGIFTEGTGTVTFDVAAGTINSNDSFNDVTIDHAGTTTLGAAMTVGDDLTLTAGTLDASASNYRIFVGGDWVDTGSGAFTERSGTVVFTGTGTLNSNEAFNSVFINDGLVGYWKFDDGSGSSAADSSGYGGTGTLGQMEEGDWTTTKPSLNFTNSYALDFDGADELVSITTDSSIPPPWDASEGTWTFWVKTDGTWGTGGSDPNNKTGVISRHDSDSCSGLVFYAKTPANGGQINFDASPSSCGGTPAVTLTGTTDITNNAWHHVAVTYQRSNGGTVTLYVDGSQEDTDTNASSWAFNSQAIRIADSLDGWWELFKGQVDDFRVYNRRLSSTEVSRLAAGNQPQATNATVTLGADLNVDGDLLLNSGTLDASATPYNITLAGNWYNNGGVFTPRSGTVTLDGTASGKFILSGSWAFNDLTINGSGGDWTLADAMDVDDDLVLTAGTLDVSSTNYGITVGGDWTDGGAGAFTEQGGTVTFDGTGTLSANETFENVTINSGGTVTLGAALDLDDTLTLTAGTLDVSGTNYGITLKSWTDSGAGTFTEQGGTVTFDVAAGTINSNETFENVTISHGGTTTLGAALDLDDTLTLTTGTLDVSGTNYGITAKSWADAGLGTFTEGSGTVTFDVAAGTINSNETFENVTINHAGTTTLGAALDLDDTLTITAGALDVSGTNYGITLKSWTDTGAGTFTEQGGTVTFDVAAGTINSNDSFNDVTIDHAGTTTLGAAMTVGDDLTLTAGELDISGTQYAITVSGDWIDTGSGTFAERSGTVTFDGTGTVNANETFYAVTINSAGTVTLGATLTTASTFTLTAGTFNTSNNNVSTPNFSSSNSNTRAISMGTGTWTLSGTGTVWTTATTTGLTLTESTSTVSITDTSATSKTFAGGGETYNDVTITGSGSGAVIFSGANTFADFTISPPKTVTFPASITTTFTGTFSCTGTSGNVITINSSTTDTQHTLSKSSGTVTCDYLSVQDSNATGGASWDPGSNSTDVSNNDGWLFNAAPSVTAGPSDGGSSTSTPTNAASNVTFTATATDAADSYYLAICKTDAITAVNSAAPTCPGGSWAISSATASGVAASVTYTTSSSDSESNAWYAFVCDNNASALCSSSSQGSGNNGSPFVVNFVPTVASLGPTALVNGSSDTDTTPTVNFDLDDDNSSDTISYQIQIDDSSDFSSAVVDYTSATGAARTALFTVGQAAGSGSYTTGSENQTLSATSYYWRVRAIDNNSYASSYSTANSGSVAFIVADSGGGGGGGGGSVSGGGASSESLAPPVEPTGGFSIVINGGDNQTSSGKVTITAKGGSNTTHLYISEDSSFAGTSQTSYNQSFTQNDIQFQLTDGAGTKTVYAKFCHQWNLCSNVVFDNIIYEPSIIEIIKETPAGISEAIKEIPGVIKDIPGQIIDKIQDIFQPEPEVTEPSLEDTLPKEAPFALSGKVPLLITYTQENKPLQLYTQAPLSVEVAKLVEKFPELEKTFSDVGITTMANLERLKAVTLTLPGLTQRLGLVAAAPEPGKFALPKGVPVANLPVDIKAQLPTEIVFAKTGGELIDFNIILSVNDQGQPEQRIITLVNKPLELVIKPDKPVNSVKGYLVLKSAGASASKEALPFDHLFASLTGANPVFAASSDKTLEERLLLLEFDYQDDDKDGIYQVQIQTPMVDGEFEIITVMDYQDIDLGKKEIRLIAVVDPEGYVYEKNGALETRIPGAIVSLYWLDPEGKEYQLWPAKEYQQENPQTTGVTGKYSFLVPRGYYYIKVDAPGYLSYDGKPFEVREGAGVHMDIEMKTKYWFLKVVDWKTLFLVFILLLLGYNFYKDKKRERPAGLSYGK